MHDVHPSTGLKGVATQVRKLAEQEQKRSEGVTSVIIVLSPQKFVDAAQKFLQENYAQHKAVIE